MISGPISVFGRWREAEKLVPQVSGQLVNFVVLAWGDMVLVGLCAGLFLERAQPLSGVSAGWQQDSRKANKHISQTIYLTSYVLYDSERSVPFHSEKMFPHVFISGCSGGSRYYGSSGGEGPHRLPRICRHKGPGWPQRHWGTVESTVNVIFLITLICISSCVKSAFSDKWKKYYSKVKNKLWCSNSKSLKMLIEKTFSKKIWFVLK